MLYGTKSENGTAEHNRAQRKCIYHNNRRSKLRKGHTGFKQIAVFRKLDVKTVQNAKSILLKPNLS